MLHRAAQIGNLEAITLLIRLGANPSIATYYNEYAHHEAAWKGHLDTLKYLLWLDPSLFKKLDENSNTAFLMAAINGHVGILSYLLQPNYSPGIDDAERCTALHMAIKFGRLSAFYFLCFKSRISGQQPVKV